MSNTNKVILSGYLGKEPMVKQFESGSRMATFTLATNESYLNSVGKRIENTQWHKLVAWGDMAQEVERQLTKGTKIKAEGKLSHRHYEAQDGTRRYVTEIVLHDFELLQFEKTQAMRA